jgi:hypothetical protein
MATWADVVDIGRSLPAVEESTSYRTPALKVAGKLIARHRTESDGGLMVVCGLDEKAALLEEGKAFYTTPHYDGYGAILVRLAEVDLDQLTELLQDAWRIKASAQLRKQADRP